MLKNFLKIFWWIIVPILYLLVMLVYINYIYTAPYPRFIDGMIYAPFGIFPGHNILIWWFSNKTLLELSNILIPEYAYMINALLLTGILGIVQLVLILFRRNKNAGTY